MKPYISIKSNSNNAVFQPFILCLLILSVLINIRYIFFSPSSLPTAVDSLNIRVSNSNGYFGPYTSNSGSGIGGEAGNGRGGGTNAIDGSGDGNSTANNNLRQNSNNNKYIVNKNNDKNNKNNNSNKQAKESSGNYPVINPKRDQLYYSKYVDPVDFEPSKQRMSSIGLKRFKDGSCVCGSDKYCLCTPSLAIDCIIEFYPSAPNLLSANHSTKSDHKEAVSSIRAISSKIKGGTRSVILVKRRDPPLAYAIPGGFVDIGESVENATIREILEETNLVINPSSLKQFRTYSDPNRDLRRHTVSVVFHTLITDISRLKRGDDAKEVVVIPVDKIKSLKLGFDHKQILLDYFN